MASVSYSSYSSYSTYSSSNLYDEIKDAIQEEEPLEASVINEVRDASEAIFTKIRAWFEECKNDRALPEKKDMSKSRNKLVSLTKKFFAKMGSSLKVSSLSLRNCILLDARHEVKRCAKQISKAKKKKSEYELKCLEMEKAFYVQLHRAVGAIG